MLTKEDIEKKYPGKKLENIKILNFYGNDFSNIDIISQMKSLKLVSLSSNKISSLKPFKNLPNLKELILRNNNIENVDEINYLKTCANLKSLWLEENPVSKKEEYKAHLINVLPNLKKLDNININEIKEEIEKNTNDRNKNNSTYNEDKLEDLLLDYEKENNNESNNDNISNKEKEENNKNNLLGSKSDIFKSEYINKNKGNATNKEENNNFDTNDIRVDENINNNKISNSIKESKNSLGFSKIEISDTKNDLLKNILNDVNTSQTIINKNNSNNQNNIDDNVNKEEKINEINNKINFTKNLDDLIKEAKLDTDNIETTMTNPNNNDNEINKILNNVDTSQTIINKNNNEVNNILKDVQSSNTNFKNIDISNSSNKNINEVQSIDDIRKMFNDDYKPNGKINMSNLYGNNNIRDTQINNIFKSEMITSESFSRNSSKQNGPYKPDFNLPDNYNYNNNYEYNNMNNNNPRRIYNIKPSHQHKIRAITNLLEDLNLENLIQVKNRIINKLNGQK